MKISRQPQQLDKSLLLNRRLIGIDGDPGAGKSTLATEIHQFVGGSITRLDDFLCLPGQPYASQYQASPLADRFRANAALPQIIEGVVLLDALEFLNAVADVLVFATRETNGIWNYDQYLLPGAPQPRDPSHKEIAEYYRRRTPWQSAQLKTTLHCSTQS